MHRRDRVGHHASRRRSIHFRQRRLRDLAKAPSDQAVMTALEDGLPKTLLVLERRLNDALIDPLPRRMRRRAWNVAIDWHLQPYYGQPFQSRNELYYGQPKQGTESFTPTPRPASSSMDSATRWP
jgi:hypothetical protein